MNMNHLERREFLKTMSRAATAALALQHAPVSNAAESPPPRATADCFILLWMAGGMANTETFDPKHYEPFQPGIEAKRVLSTFPAINTTVDGINFTTGLEEMASVMHEGSLIRTFTLPIVDKIVHSRHQYHWHTGYLPPLNVAAPHIGAVIARTLGPRHPDVPAFIDIAETFAEAGREANVLRSFLSAGFLGAEYGPFIISRLRKRPNSFGRTLELTEAKVDKRHFNRCSMPAQQVNSHRPISKSPCCALSIRHID